MTSIREGATCNDADYLYVDRSRILPHKIDDIYRKNDRGAPRCIDSPSSATTCRRGSDQKGCFSASRSASNQSNARLSKGALLVSDVRYRG